MNVEYSWILAYVIHGHRGVRGSWHPLPPVGGGGGLTPDVDTGGEWGNSPPQPAWIPPQHEKFPPPQTGGVKMQQNPFLPFTLCCTWKLPFQRFFVKIFWYLPTGVELWSPKPHAWTLLEALSMGGCIGGHGRSPRGGVKIDFRKTSFLSVSRRFFRKFQGGSPRDKKG